jgi:hypothetical protein
MARLTREKIPVLMRFSCQDLSVFSACHQKSPDEKTPPKTISSLEKGGISGEQGFKASGRRKLAVFPAKKLSY